MNQSEIKIGDPVRSFDFDYRDIEGPNACFIEGTVVDIVKPEWSGCEHYEVECTRKVFGGKEIAKFEDVYFPPKNGVKKMFGGVCNHVELIK